jgi:predicted transcriptional regulator
MQMRSAAVSPIVTRKDNFRTTNNKQKQAVTTTTEELKMNRRTLQRDLKLLVEKGLVPETGTGPTDPTKYYQPLL